jgi:4-hydroxybenzoate polyprenyltransferase
MAEIFNLVIQTARPVQWIKNFALYAGLVLTGWLFLPDKLIRTSLAFLVFCLLTSSVYFFNDLLDAPSDREHPLKKHRPIASGALPLPLAIYLTITGFIISLFLASQLSFFFFLVCLAYLILQTFYTLYFKHIPIIDVLSIASGFILRVYAGAVVINTHINIWLLLCIISFSLFLAVGKRRSERTLLTGKSPEKHREVLSFYPEKLLDQYIAMFANTTWLTYALYTSLHPPIKPSGRLLNLWVELPLAFRSQKWMMITIPIVIYGVMRYLQLIYQRNEGDSPAQVLVSDKPLLTAVGFWGLLIIFIIYGMQ